MRKVFAFLVDILGIYGAVIAFNSMSTYWHIPVFGLLGFLSICAGNLLSRIILKGEKNYAENN